MKTYDTTLEFDAPAQQVRDVLVELPSRAS